MLDLEFDQEQELLRQTVRDVLARHCSLDVVRAMEDDPVGLSRCAVGAAGRARSHRPAAARGVRRLGHDPGRGGGALRGAGPAAGADTTLRQRGPRAAGCWPPPGARRRRSSGCAPSPPGRRSSPRPGSSPRTAISPAASRCGPRPRASGFRLSGVKRHVAFAVGAPIGSSCWPARVRRPTTVDLFLVDPAAVGVTLRQQFTISSDTQYEVTFTDVVVSEDDRIGPAGSGLGHLAGGARAGAGAPGRPGGGWRPLCARDHHAVRARTASSSTSRSAPSRRWPTTWPTPSPTSTGPSSWCTKRPGPAPTGGR